KRHNRVLSIFSALLLLLSIVFPGVAGADSFDDNHTSSADKINESVIKSFEKNDTITYLIKFKEKADNESAMKTAIQKAEAKELSAEEIQTAKQAAVVNTLKETSKTTQEDVLDYLQTEVKAGNAADIHSYFIVNGIAVTSTEEVAREVASFEQVDKVLPNETRDLITNDVNRGVANDVDEDIAWNVDRIGATKIWDKGIDGTGIVVASIDSGVQWNHPALKEKYRGYDAETGEVNHSFSWFDAVTDKSEPYDDVGHG